LGTLLPIQLPCNLVAPPPRTPCAEDEHLQLELVLGLLDLLGVPLGEWESSNSDGYLRRQQAAESTRQLPGGEGLVGGAMFGRGQVEVLPNRDQMSYSA
jgi:hypothetical protein